MNTVFLAVIKWVLIWNKLRNPGSRASQSIGDEAIRDSQDEGRRSQSLDRGLD